MDVKLYPSKLLGSIEAPSCKSMMMRMFLAAALCEEETKIYLKTETSDFFALKTCLESMGVSISGRDGTYSVTGDLFGVENTTVYEVGESLATLRFMAPIVCAVCGGGEFIGEGKLQKKNVSEGFRFLKGVVFSGTNTPIVFDGRLSAGEYLLPNGISTQILSGLLFALPLLEEDSILSFETKPKENVLIDMTIFVMRLFGIKIEETDKGYSISGGQTYVSPGEISVEGDYGASAYFLCANLLDSEVKVDNLNKESLQIEKIINQYIQGLKQDKDVEIDISGQTDFAFILSVVACAKNYNTKINGVLFDKIKDAEKMSEFVNTLNRMGGKISYEKGVVSIVGLGGLKGGVMVDGATDYRIAAALIIASTICENPITLLSAEVASKLYNTFINDFIKLGGKCETI